MMMMWVTNGFVKVVFNTVGHVCSIPLAMYGEIGALGWSGEVETGRLCMADRLSGVYVMRGRVMCEGGSLRFMVTP
ncbi:hypothetical protein JCGZ_10549 [Jatropha curcas]|uniref:Uncharacterized protein n=1 Tax=Jatropha curcas TaxID=180498 RepID=A0A067KSH9_JATCU|nr:hypothetical protein JCGZ_10549 [Jatropha curcas]